MKTRRNAFIFVPGESSANNQAPITLVHLGRRSTYTRQIGGNDVGLSIDRTGNTVRRRNPSSKISGSPSTSSPAGTFLATPGNSYCCRCNRLYRENETRFARSGARSALPYRCSAIATFKEVDKNRERIFPLI